MDNKTLVVGAFALAIGVLLGMLLSPSGPGIDEIRKAMNEELAAAGEKTAAIEQKLGGVADQVSALTGKVGAIETSAAALAAKVGTEAAGAGSEVESLAKKIEELAGSLTSRVSEAAESHAAALRQGLAALAPTAATAPAAAPAATPAAATPAATPTGDPQGLTAGQTASFADGEVRVTVSRVDDATGAARLAVNGTVMTLAAGSATMVEPCKVQLDSVDRGHAAISAVCGDELPAATGIAPGAAMVLGDGAARVFLSGVSADGSSARVAINGQSLQVIPAGGKVPVEGTDCTVSVDSIDRGRVAFGYACGG